MIITIDGPAGSGKSTVAKELAQRLGFRYLDTGAMYRAVALAGMRHCVDWDQPDQMARLVQTIDLRTVGSRIFLDGEDVTQIVRHPEVTVLTRYAAGNAEVRKRLVQLQIDAAGGDDIVTEGRDQGTVVFPNAQLKIFLTASPEERAQRRLHDLQALAAHVTFDEVFAAQQLRDREDSERQIGPLVPAADAIEVSTDGLSVAQVIDRLESLAQEKM